MGSSALEAQKHEILAAREKRSKPKMSAKQVRDVAAEMPHIRKCRNRMRRPRKVSKKKLETIIAMSLK